MGRYLCWCALLASGLTVPAFGQGKTEDAPVQERPVIIIQRTHASVTPAQVLPSPSSSSISAPVDNGSDLPASSVLTPSTVVVPGEKVVGTGPVLIEQGPVFPADRSLLSGLWGKAEYLLWWQKGQPVPPLVTTSPIGTPRELAGVLGQPGTTILFGDSREGDGPMSGGRFTIGYWCDPQQCLGIETNFFFLGREDFGFNDFSNGSRIIARPFFDVTHNMQASELVSYPDVLSGSVDVAGSSELFGAEALLRCRLCDNCWDPCLGACGPMWKVDLVGGYRFLYLRERLGIHEDLTSIDPNNPFIVPGTRFIVDDQFRTTNQFHGGQIGIASEFRKGRWGAQGVAKIALGVNHQTADVAGSSFVSVPGGGTKANPGGLLAQPTNIGHYERDEFAVVPEVGIALNYYVTQRLKLSVGYNLIYWWDVARPGEQIDLAVNITQIGGNPLDGPARPQFNFNDSSYWVQGLTFGLQFDF